ncbi:MAG: co-chaperone GroES [Candidatus Saccharimonadia bacterium]
MKLQPLADRVVAKPIEAETKTASGFYLTETAKEKPQIGEVLAVGKDVKEVSVGDKIVYTKYGPNEIKVDNQDMLLLKEEDILAVVKD